MTKALFLQAIGKFAFGLILIGLLLFLPAGSFAYPQAWLFLGVLFVPMLIAGIILMIRNPELLRKRLDAKEKQKGQKALVIISGVLFAAAFIVAGLNFRFSWITMPVWSAYAGAIIFLLAYLIYAEALRENPYLSRTIEVQEDQKVIDTGLYGVVRHPMYTATLFMFLAMGFILGSPISSAIMLIYIPIIVIRILREEKLLKNSLPGYAEYRKRVRIRLLPMIW